MGVILNTQYAYKVYFSFIDEKATNRKKFQLNINTTVTQIIQPTNSTPSNEIIQNSQLQL